MRPYPFLLCLGLLCGCQSAKTLSEALSLRVVYSEMERQNEASYIDGQQGRLKWNYTTGLELKAFIDVYDVTGDTVLLNYVDHWYDAIIDSTGRIQSYKQHNYSTDHICPGRTLFRLYELTGREKYRQAIDTLRQQIARQPRTPEGGFWHKQIYPEQMWLDGLYMAQPFYAEYALRYEHGARQQESFADILRQFQIVAQGTYDPQTRLYRHAWDASRSQFWADPVSGQSAHAWGRALGWYCMALVDVLPLIPQETVGWTEVRDIFRGIFAELPRWADPESGMWYQVLDRPGDEGNYVEATASAMFCYALLKGIRLGLLDEALLPYARDCYTALLRTFVREDAQGQIQLEHCCEVAGLGGKTQRRGDYDYYIHENVRSNDPKGIGPLIWAALEYEKL